MAGISSVSPISYCWGLLLFPLGLLAYKTLFPSHSRKVKKKLVAYLLSKLMRLVHSKCVHQKAALFKSLKSFETQDSRPEILEFGVGPCLNLDYLPSDCSFTCLEPNTENRPYVERSLTNFPGIRLARFVKGFVEDMKEFEDNTFDAVVCTFTLCSVRHPQKALSEVKRVLKEHVFLCVSEGWSLSLHGTRSSTKDFNAPFTAGLRRLGVAYHS